MPGLSVTPIFTKDIKTDDREITSSGEELEETGEDSEVTEEETEDTQEESVEDEKTKDNEREVIAGRQEHKEDINEGTKYGEGEELTEEEGGNLSSSPSSPISTDSSGTDDGFTVLPKRHESQPSVPGKLESNGELIP